MSGSGVIIDDLAAATVNAEESECLKDKSNSFSNLTFCCVCCFRRRNETNSIQRRGKKKRNKRNEEEDHTGAVPLDKPDKEEQQRKGQDHWSIVSLGEHDHGDAVTLAAKPCNIEIQDNLSAVLLDVHYNEEKQKHLNATSPNAHCKEQQRKDRQNYLNNLSPGAQYERGKQGGQDHVSAVCEGAPTNEEQVCQGEPYKEKQQPMGPEHLRTLSLGVTYEKEKHGGQHYMSTESEGAPSKEEQDCQGVPHKKEQQPMGLEHPNNLSLGVTYEQEKQGGQDHVSSESEGAAYIQEQDCQGVLYKEEQQPMGPEHPNNLSLSGTYEQEKQGEQNHVRSESEGAAYKEEQDSQGVLYKEEQQFMESENLSTLSLGVTYEKEKQEGQDHVSTESEGAPSKEEQDCQGVPYQEEQQPMGPEHPNNLSLGGTYEQEKQGQDHVSTESEGAAYKEKQDCQGVLYKEEQQPIGPELLSTLFLDITYEKEQQVGKDHESSVSEGASYKEKQYYQGAPYSKQQQTMGPEQLSTLSPSGIFEEEQHVRKDHLNSRSLGALCETDKQLGQDRQSNLFLFMPYDEGKQQDGQDHQNTMLLSVPWDSERELREGQDPQKIISLYVPCEEEEQKEKQDLANTMVLCVPCEKEKHQEGQNLLCTLCEKEMKQEDGQQDHLSPISLCVTCKEDENEEEEQDLLNSTFLYEP